jgi:hypothetical protein
MSCAGSALGKCACVYGDFQREEAMQSCRDEAKLIDLVWNGCGH